VSERIQNWRSFLCKEANSWPAWREGFPENAAAVGEAAFWRTAQSQPGWLDRDPLMRHELDDVRQTVAEEYLKLTIAYFEFIRKRPPHVELIEFVSKRSFRREQELTHNGENREIPRRKILIESYAYERPLFHDIAA